MSPWWGPSPCLRWGERLLVTGKWSTHASYGRQFEAEFLERLMPQSAMEILELSEQPGNQGHRPENGHPDCGALWQRNLAIMEREPERLSEVAGISREKARAIGEEFRLQVGIRS